MIPIETLLANVDPASFPLFFLLALWMRRRFDSVDRRIDRLEATTGIQTPPVSDGGQTTESGQ